MSRRIVFVLSVVLLCASALGPALTVHAGAHACGTMGWYWYGRNHNYDDTIGAMAQISWTAEPNLCTPVKTGDSSSVWVMVSDGDSPYPAGCNLVQAGYIRDGSQTQSYIFVEWFPNTCIGVQKKYVYQLPGSNNWYKVGLDQASGYWYLAYSTNGSTWTNVQKVHDSQFAWGDLMKTAYRAETHNTETTIYGTSATPVVFSSMQLKDRVTDTWTAESNLADQKDSGIAHHANMTTISSTSFKLWDSWN